MDRFRNERADLEDLIDQLKNGHNYDYTKELADPRAIYERIDYENRILYVYDVDEYLVDDIIKPIIYFNEEDKGKPVDKRKTIELRVRSDGGNLMTCFGIITACQLSKTKIRTVNMGCACSAGAYIFLAGDERLIFPNSLTLFHRGSASQMGNYDEVVGQTSQYKKDQKFLENYVLSRTTIPKSTWNKKMKSDWYVSNEDCLKYGIATKEIESFDEIGN